MFLEDSADDMKKDELQSRVQCADPSVLLRYVRMQSQREDGPANQQLLKLAKYELGLRQDSDYREKSVQIRRLLDGRFLNRRGVCVF
jgi:hypothetical protein